MLASTCWAMAFSAAEVSVWNAENRPSRTSIGSFGAAWAACSAWLLSRLMRGSSLRTGAYQVGTRARMFPRPTVRPSAVIGYGAWLYVILAAVTASVP